MPKNNKAWYDTKKKKKNGKKRKSKKGRR